MKKRPIITPSVHRVTFAYWLVKKLVKQAARRFHRFYVQSGLENLPEGKEPYVLISNHQNGMMDGLNIGGGLSKQYHFIARADVFWNPYARWILMSANQMPIYRQRDRLTDLRERNNIIWDSCVERLQLGAALALFPEGNHNPQKNIRDLKRGVSDFLGRALTKHSDLKRIKLIPLGQDYESYPGYRRRWSVRVGKHIEWVDLYDEKTGIVDFKALAVRMKKALGDVAVDLQPKEEYWDIYPYVRALRTSEAENEEWSIIQSDIKRIKVSAENKSWLTRVKSAAENLRKAGYTEVMRPEAWGTRSSDTRSVKYWAIVLQPLGWLGNLPTVIQEILLDKKGEQVKKVEFRSTMKIGAAMVVYPLSWTLMAIAVACVVSSQGIAPWWVGFFGMWTFATYGNKFSSWLKGHLHDHRDALRGRKFWGDKKMTNLREAWVEYIEVIKS
jgi:1-acyl-sn-glycerol-3-phosphate acyltransferase